jgi:hypothetical protein
MLIVMPRWTLLGSGVDRREVARDVDGRGYLSARTFEIAAVSVGLAVVDVTDRSDVDVRLGPLELGLSHLGPPQDLNLP